MMQDLININEISDELLLVLLYGFLGFVLAMLITPLYTKYAYKYKWWKKQRTDATTGEKATVFNRLHAKKHSMNIPTMAGLITVSSIILITLLFNLSREQTYLPIAATLGAAAVGIIDDIINLRGIGQGVAGLSSRLKFSMISAVAFLGGAYFYTKLGYESIYIPFTNGLDGSNIKIGIGLVALFLLVVVSTANAVNITDGLDGLAGGLLVNAFAAYATIAFLQGNFGIAGFCMTIVGALLSYVWFNIHPARFFMGDVGSFALGTALGVVAMLTDTVVLLPVIGFMFVLEAGSSLIQILSKKIRGKKIFISAPLHHHFEAIGWPESKVTMRFWVVGQVCGVAGIILAIMGGFV